MIPGGSIPNANRNLNQAPLCHTSRMVRVQLMHAGEEALLVLIPVAILLAVEYRNRRSEKARTAPQAGSDPDNEPGEAAHQSSE
jgi:hypothetical protein